MALRFNYGTMQKAVCDCDEYYCNVAWDKTYRGVLLDNEMDNKFMTGCLKYVPNQTIGKESMASAAYQQSYPQQQQYQQLQESTAPEPKNDEPVYIDTQHDDMIHDAQLDYYGCKLATCSSGK